MASGMWTAAAGASAQAQNLDSIANNLANADTPAYKKDTPTFKEYLSAVERQKDNLDIPRGPIKDKDLYPLDGRDQSYVVVDGTHVNHQQGAFRITRNPLDVALDGPGFLEVSTPQGIRYTRFGSLKMAADGRLATSEGYAVLASQTGGISNNSNDVATRFINLRDQGRQFTVSQEGEIYSGDNLVAKLSVVEFKNRDILTKVGGQLFENKNPNNREASLHTIVRQGLIETSNVNPIEEMANLIKTNRLFEQDLKALKTYGELLGKEANEVGKL